MNYTKKIGLAKQMYRSQKQHGKKHAYKHPSYSKDEFIVWLLKDDAFNDLYKSWKHNGFCKELKPSIDRIDDYAGYSFDNIRVCTWRENLDKYYEDLKSRKNTKTLKPVMQYDLNGNFMLEHASKLDASRSTGVNTGGIGECLRGKRKTAGGFRWKRKT